VSVVLLSGGSGGAKLARGLYEILGPALTVIANTGDDIEIYGAHVSPDPDLVTYWLADRIDERGWGIADDSFNAMAMLGELGTAVTFNLGDRDLALCIERTRLLTEGLTQTEAHARLVTALGVSATVLPMSDDAVRTRIRSNNRWVGLQEFLIELGGSAPIDAIDFEGAAAANPSPAALAALANARAIIIGPSNPIISIGPILALHGMRDALRAAPAPVVAVSPIVDGAVLKGPTAACMSWAGHSTDAPGILAVYAGLLDGVVADEPVEAIPWLQTPTLMSTPAERRALAERTLEFCEQLRAAPNPGG
jgi:LPPG:FO 2-phospho-L-lactate transferase